MTASPRNRACLGIFLICMATLMYELLLTRIFSVLMWYHFASIAISLALFGGGAAAMTVCLLPKRFPPERLELQTTRFSLLFALSVSLFFGLFVLFRLQPHLAFRILSFFHQPFYQPFQQGFQSSGIPTDLLLGLTGLYLVTALPFYFAGLAVTLLLTHRLAEINRLYFWDLMGAGTGCLGVIALLKALGGVTAILAIAAIGLLAALSFRPATTPRAPIWILLILLALAGGANFLNGYAEIRFARGRYEPNLLWSAWNSFSRVAAYPSGGEEQERAWGLSRAYRGAIPEQIGMVVDDTGYTTLYRWEGEKTLEFFRSNIIALPYLLKEAPEALVIGPGGGKDVLAALAMGASRIDAVEVNGLIVAAVNDVFGDFTGELYRRPEVNMAVDEARSFIRRSQRRYGIIQASAVFGRMAPAAGAFTLSENNLYTVEAFRDYWQHLDSDGILTISRFIFERETLRMVSLGLALLKEEGVADPASHLAVVKERGLANFMLKRSPFTPEEIALLRQTATELEFEVVFLPDQREGSGAFSRLIADGGSAAYYRSLPFDISPTTDDRPFFYYMYRPLDFLRLLSFPEQSNFEDRAVLTIRNLLAVVSVLVALVLLLPLLLRRRDDLRTPGTARRLVYFACLGLGFMLIEIALLRRFILFLGPPIYALAVILFSLLVFSGLGALAAGKCPPGGEKPVLRQILLALVLLSSLYAFILPPILDAWIALPLLGRALLAGGLLAPLGLLLGVPLPLGMRLFHRDAIAVPWSWGVNSAASVLAAILAAVLAMNVGFTWTLVTGQVCYIVALIAVWRQKHEATHPLKPEVGP